MFLGGGAAGAVFILASIVTKGAVGIGDGYILMVCGMVLGLYQVVILSILALCLASAFGILLWVRKKRADIQKYHLHHLYVPVMG